MISGASYCSVTEHGGIPVSPEWRKMSEKWWSTPWILRFQTNSCAEPKGMAISEWLYTSRYGEDWKIVERFDYTMNTSHRQHQQSFIILLMIWYLNIPNLSSVQSRTRKKLIHTIYLLTPAIGTYERLVMPTYYIAKAKLTTPYPLAIEDGWNIPTWLWWK